MCGKFVVFTYQGCFRFSTRTFMYLMVLPVLKKCTVMAVSLYIFHYKLIVQSAAGDDLTCITWTLSVQQMYTKQQTTPK